MVDGFKETWSFVCRCEGSLIRSEEKFGYDEDEGLDTGPLSGVVHTGKRRLLSL